MGDALFKNESSLKPSPSLEVEKAKPLFTNQLEAPTKMMDLKKDDKPLFGNAKGEDANIGEGELPWYIDYPLAGAAYGLTALALSPTGVGTIATGAIAAPVYLATKSLITGQLPQPVFAQHLPGAEYVPSAVLGTAEETAIWALGGPLLKGLGKAGKATAKGVEWLATKPLAPIVKGMEPVGNWVWKGLKYPTQLKLPLYKKSFAETFQPAIERIETALPDVAKTFRDIKIERNLIGDMSRTLGRKLQAETPEVAYELSQKLGQKHMAMQVKNPRTKALIGGIKDDLKDLNLNEKYKEAFHTSLVKVFPKKEPLPESMINLLTKTKNAPIKQVHKSLREIINNPQTSHEMKVLARDLWITPIHTPLKIAEAARTASLEHLVSRLPEMPGVVSSTLKKDYVHSAFGKLKGSIIHKDVELELQAMVKIPKIAEGAFNKYFMTPWKTNKVVLRPASHIRNLLSNVILNDWGGLPFYRMDMYTKALRGMRTNDPSWKKFQRLSGVTSTNYTYSDLAPLVEGMKEKSKAVHMIDRGLHLFDAMVSPVRGIYNAEESMFKYAKYLHNMEKGFDKEEAAYDAIKWTFNYGEITPEIAQIGKWAMPFVRWYNKAIPLGLETAVKHPVRFGKWLGFGAALQQQALSENKISEQEWERINENLPEYMQKGLYLLMPWRDEKKHLNLLDLTFTMPFVGDVSELMQKSPIETILQNPVFTMASTLKSKTKFSGAPLYHDWESGTDKFSKVMLYAWEQLTPSLAPKGTDWNKLHKAFTEQDSALSAEQALASIVGFKITPIGTIKQARTKRAIKRIYNQEIYSSLRRELKTSSSADETKEVLERYRGYRTSLKD